MKKSKKFHEKIIFVTYNLYKGGSLRLLKAMYLALKDHPNIEKFQPRYPVRYANFLYRLLLDQFFVPWLRFKTAHLVMFGNIPSLLFTGKQVILIHNPNYWRTEWRKLSLRNKLEFYYFYSTNFLAIKFKKVRYVTQINSVEENFKKLFPYAKVKTIGSPFDVDDLTINVDKLLKYRLEIQSKVVEENYFYYPAYFYESKNHKLLSEVSKNLKKDFGISIVCSNGGGLDGIIGYSDLSFEENILLLMNCSALIFPSEFETFGYPLIEAAILKKPILVLNRDYSTSLISNAYFFENNIQSLIEACLDYAKDFDSNNVKIPVIKISINPSDFLQAISEQLECKYEEN